MPYSIVSNILGTSGTVVDQLEAPKICALSASLVFDALSDSCQYIIVIFVVKATTQSC